jgi:hypothetical protein
MPGLPSVPWIAVTLADLQDAQAGPLVTAFQTTALASGQSDPTGRVIANISDEILGSIGFSGRYTMDASQGTVTPNVIPPNLKDLCVKKVCRVLKGRLNMVLLPDQTQDERTYQSTLLQLREGRFPINATSNPSGSNIAVKPGLVTLNLGQRRQFEPHDLRNL